MVAAREASRQRRQQNSPQRHAQYAGRKLHQAVSVIHPGDRAGDQERGENRVDDERDLAHRYAENGRPHLFHDAHRARIFKINARQHQHADFLQVRQLINELQHAADRDRPRERQHRRVKVRRGEKRKANHADIQKRGRKRWHRKAVPGVKDCARERGQRNQQNIRKGNTQQRRGEREFIGRIGKARRGHQDHPRCGQHTGYRHHKERQRQQARDIRHKHTRGVFALLAFIFGEDRHKRLRERAFGKNTPQQVRQFKRHKEGVSRHPGPEHPRHDGVARKPEHAGKHRHRADRSQRLQ
ncbi:hypothetical protein BN130_184 [Cronobacter malonaticus 507]|nr:hypothetical protein BN131_3984 [Cronobacter malonaticus 681]CCJ97721.1 hypothetical protein BN130_184 [Cronobacter malonaticus 507]